MRLLLVTSALIVACAIAPGVAASFHGDESVDWAMFPPPTASSAPLPEKPPDRHWYGWQTLLVDAAGVTMFVGGVGSRDGQAGTTVAILGTAIFVAGPAITHFAHHGGGAGPASLGIRGGALALFILGFTWTIQAQQVLDGGGAGNDATGRAGIVLLCSSALGLLFAPVIDAAVLSYEPSPAKTSDRPKSVVAIPFATRGAGGIALAGTF